MNLTGKQVTHEKFGVGTVTEQTDSAVTVLFGGSIGQRKFLYPSAFASFLHLCSEDTAREMDEQLEKIRADEEQRRRVAEAEEEKRCKDVRASVLEQKKASAAKRSAARKKAVQKRLDAFDAEAEETENAEENDQRDGDDIIES